MDLYYRLNIFPITVPPLRDRREDIPLLARFFVQDFAARMRKPIDAIPAEAMAALVNYAWPGNIRELRNVIETFRYPLLRYPAGGPQGRP